MKPLALMKKLVLLLLVIAGGFLILSAIPHKETPPQEPIFMVQTRSGKTIEITKVEYYSLFEINDYSTIVSLDTDIGFFQMRKDLQDVRLIEVLSDDGTQLRVTFEDGAVLEGKRQYKKKPRDNPRNPLDIIRGDSGRLYVSLNVSEVVSITRKEQGNG